MKKLTKQQLVSVEAWVYANARPLEAAKLKLTLGKGSADDLVNELLKYQNGDGGFGNSLEPDVQTPESSATVSAEAIFTALDYNLDLSAEWAGKMYAYFERTRQNTPSFWEAVPKSIEAYPHPRWWNYGPDTVFSPNPCAVIASALIAHGSDAQKALGREAAVKCMDFLNGGEACGEHETYCLQRLYLALRGMGSELADGRAAESTQRRVAANVCFDESKWASYVPQPLDLVYSPSSPWYPVVKQGVADNIAYWLNSLKDGGYWEANFSWGDDSEISRRVMISWKGYIAAKRVRILKAFDAVEL